MNKLSKEERKKIFKKMEGFYNNKVVFDYYKPEKDSTQKIQAYNWLHVKYIDPLGEYALFKGLQLIPKTEYSRLTQFNTSPDIKDLYAFSIQGCVANYDKATGEICLNSVDYDDKSSWSYRGTNGRSFYGITTECSVNTALKGDEYLFGGNVGGSTLRKMKCPLKEFKYKDFDAVYLQQYENVYTGTN